MKPESTQVQKEAKKPSSRLSGLASDVAIGALVVFFFVLYLSFTYSIGWITDYLPAWLYYTLLAVGVLYWIGSLLSRLVDWMEKDLARMDKKTKAKRAGQTESSTPNASAVDKPNGPV